MRGRRDPQPSVFYAIGVGDRIRPDHPPRPIKAAVGRLPAGLSDRFDAAHSPTGRPGRPPERLVKALRLVAPDSVRRERPLVERLGTDLPFRWLLGVGPAEPAFDAPAFAPNRPRVDEHGLTAAFFQAVLGKAPAAGPGGEHFGVGGALIESSASVKSARPRDEPRAPDPPPPAAGDGFKPRTPDGDFHGRRRTNATPRGATDPAARRCRTSAGPEAKPRHAGHALGENRHGLRVGVTVTAATGAAGRAAAVGRIDAFRGAAGGGPATAGLDTGDDSGGVSLAPGARGGEPHGALTTPPPPETAAREEGRENVAARPRMAARTSGEGYRLSHKGRKNRGGGCGWLTAVAGPARGRLVGRRKVRQWWEVGAAASNSVRMRSLSAAAGAAGGGPPAGEAIDRREFDPAANGPARQTDRFCSSLLVVRCRRTVSGIRSP